jgi:hypothetical protein
VKALNFLYKHAAVIEKEYHAEKVSIVADLPAHMKKVFDELLV